MEGLIHGRVRGVKCGMSGVGLEEDLDELLVDDDLEKLMEKKLMVDDYLE